MRETEITVEVLNNPEEIDGVLKSRGYEFIHEFQMNDYYFAKFSTQELKKFDYEELIKKSFLVRQFIENGETFVELIFKDKVLDENKNVISEEKTKCKISELEPALKIFKQIGLNCWIELKQHLKIYKKDKLEFAVQEVEDLGTFIEYEEDESMAAMTEEEKIKTMLNNLKDLGLKFGTDYSCKKVYMKFCK